MEGLDSDDVEKFINIKSIVKKEESENKLKEFLKDSIMFVCYDKKPNIFVGACPRWLYFLLREHEKNCDELNDLYLDGYPIYKIFYQTSN